MIAPQTTARLLAESLDRIAGSEPDYLVENALGEVEVMLGGISGPTGFADALCWQLDDIRQRMLDDAGKRDVGDDGLLQYRIDCDQDFYARQFAERVAAIMAPLQAKREVLA